LEHAARAIAEQQTTDGVTTAVAFDSWRRPMERTRGTERLAADAIWLASQYLGFTLTEEATGGGSDACESASVGTATLDGLGPVGGDDHSPREWLDLSSIVPRVALVALLMLTMTSTAAPNEAPVSPVAGPE
jgi:glutamate carboxypeptidase